MADPAAGASSDDERYPEFERTTADVNHRIGYLIARLSTTEGGSANVG